MLRVLFHTGSDPGGRRQMLLNRQQRVCIVLHASLQNAGAASSSAASAGGPHAGQHTAGRRPGPLSAACSPEGEDGVCLAQLTVPAHWWPALPPPDARGAGRGAGGRAAAGKPVKTPPRLVQVAYSVLEPRPIDGQGCVPRLQIQPVTVLGVVPLVPAKAAYKELRLGGADVLTMLVPHPPLYPLSRMHIPVFIDRDTAKQLTAIVVR